MGKRWTHEEDEILRIYYPERGAALADLLPNRTACAIIHRKERLKIRRIFRKKTKGTRIVKDTARNREIRRRRLAGELLHIIGKDYGITRESVRQICLGIPNINRIRNVIDKRIRAEIKQEKKAFDVIASFHAGYKKGRDDECWEWTKAKNPITGYGSHAKGSKTVFAGVGRTAHRRAWYLATGEMPPRGRLRCIMHTCDNNLCVNPAHLILGTAKMNHYDAVLKGRKRNQWIVPKLSNSDVIEIRETYKTPADCIAMAEKYNVSATLVYTVARGIARTGGGKEQYLRRIRKLTNYQAKAIRSMYSTGRWSMQKLGDYYGLHLSSIRQIVKGKTYKDV